MPGADSPSHDGRKRRRPEGAGHTILPPSELSLPATGRQDAASLFESLSSCFGAQVEEAQVEDAVESGVWTLEQVQPCAAGAGLLAGDRACGALWAPSLDRVEEWSFENGALCVFVAACAAHWRRRVEQAWRAWNDELGNNALEWRDLWRGATVGDSAANNVVENAGPSLSRAPAARASTRKARVGGEGRAAPVAVKQEEPADAPPTTPDGMEGLADADIFSVDIGDGPEDDDCLIFDDAGGWIGPNGIPVAGSPASTLEDSLVMSDSDDSATSPRVVMACEDNDPYPPMDLC
jgi:hypothetical protein